MKYSINNSFIHPRYWPIWVVLLLMRVLTILPLPILAGLGTIVGELSFHLFATRRKIAECNLNACFPSCSDDEVKKIARKCFQTIGQSIFFTGVYWWASPKRFNRIVTIINRNDYDDALLQNRNIILLAPHFCALEVAGLVLSQERPMITMYQFTKNKLVDKYAKQGRGRFDGILVERGESLRKLIKLIIQGYPFYYLPDQDARDKGIFAPFFGVQASTIPFLGKFAAISNAVVIPVSTKILPYGRGFEVAFGKPLNNFPSGDELADTTIMNKAIEALIMTMPEQYFWVHKRFKTRPTGDPLFY